MTKLIEFTCEECGANETARAFDCCDNCIVKVFMNNPNASTLDELREGN